MFILPEGIPKTKSKLLSMESNFKNLKENQFIG